MGKDVVSFLSWAAEPEMEERKLVGLSSFLCAGANCILVNVGKFPMKLLKLLSCSKV